MITNVRDISEWYPFMPYESDTPTSGTDIMNMKSIAANVLDAKISVVLPAQDLREYDGVVPLCYVMTGLDNNSAQIKRYGQESTRSIPVFIGRDCVPDVDSYIILDTPLENAVSYHFILHPACLYMTQEPSAPLFYERRSEDVASDESCAADPISMGTNRLAFTDGHNVRVAFMNNGITVDAGPGYGLGIYEEPPYSDVSTYDLVSGVGLRTIQGEANAAIVGDRHCVDVDTSLDIITDDNSPVPTEGQRVGYSLNVKIIVTVEST